MNLDDIKLNWKVLNNNKDANINLWDAKAQHFGTYNLPTYYDDKFLNLLKEKELINEEFRILDVGCGGGKYALAIANHCRHITGLDLSSKMIEYSNENKQKHNIKNSYFEVEDWHELDVINSKHYKKYDLVYASLTPAVQSYETFEKISQASKNHCLIRFNTMRSDSVYDEVKKLLNIKSTKSNINKNVMYAFNTLWLKGHLPEIYYEDKKWFSKEKVDKAFDIYIKMIKSFKEISEDDKIIVNNYLNSISKDGYVEEDIKSTISILYWNVNK